MRHNSLAGEDLTYLTAFRILVIESFCSFKPSFTTKFKIWAQHRIWRYLFSKIASGPLRNFFKCNIAVSLELALSSVMVNIRSTPHLPNNSTNILPIASPLWLPIWRKFRILLHSFQSLLIQWAVKHRFLLLLRILRCHDW